MSDKATGRKADSDKPPMQLIPRELDEAAARAFAYGAGKYDEYNWMGGILWGRLWSAIKRHLDAWWSGEDFDTESGLSHLDHAAAGLGMLIATSIHRPDLDNRPPKWPVKEVQNAQTSGITPLPINGCVCQFDSPANRCDGHNG